MRFPQTYTFRSQYPTGVKGVTGAAPQTVAGNAFDAGLAALGLCARVYAKATTNTLTLTAKWQVLDDDGSTWCDAVDEQNPAPVALVTGTGAAVSKIAYISAPMSVIAGSRQARLVVVSGTASGGGAGTDECSIAYDMRQPVTSYGG